MREEQFIELPSQGSIYSVTRLGSTLVVGSGDHGKIFAFPSRSAANLEEVSLPDLPQDIEIIAVDAFMDPCPVLAVTFVQKSGGGDAVDKPKASLHIYSSWTEPDSPTSNASTSSPEGFGSKSNSPKSSSSVKDDSNCLEMIGQHSKTFKLDYIPYDLTHVPVRKDKDSYEQIFLLTGSDRRVHAFQGDKTTFSEIPVEKYFPEISRTFDSLVTRVQVESINDAVRRISMCGCEDGTLHIWTVTSPFRLRKGSDGSDKGEKDDELIEAIEHHFEGMITSIQFFTDGFQFNAVVSSACSPVFIYTNTIEDHFTKGTALKFSSRWDTIEAVCVADIDLDGQNEIIVGTFGCTMLVYKYLDEIMPQWVIVAHKKFSSGILSIEFIKNYALHVVTASGIHVIEYSTSAYFHKHTNMISGAIPEETTADSTDSLTFKVEQE